MSPEQAMGDRELDARSDVYSLGAMLYEMLAGDPPYTGSTAQAIVAKVITEKAPLVTTARDTVPPHVAAAIAKALAKLPADRFKSAADFGEALGGGRFALPATTAGPSAMPAASSPSRSPAVLVLTAAAVAATALAAWGWLRPQPAPVVSRFNVLFEEYQLTYASDAPAISPDGSHIVYTGPEGTLVLRERDQVTPKPIPDADNGWAPFFSPDGANIAFYTGFPGALKVVPISGGSPRTLVPDSAYGNGGAWSDDGWIYYTGGSAGELRLMRVRAEGGTPELVAAPDREAGELFYYWPDVLPGGTKALVTVWRRKGDADIAALDIATGAVSVLTRGVRALYAPTGHLVVVRGDGTLAAALFDPDESVLAGRLTPLVEGIWIGGQGRTPIAMARDGTLLYQASPPSHQVVRVGRDGSVQAVDPAWSGRFGSLSLSPDGSRLAVAVEQGGKFEMWVKAMPTGPFTRLAFDGTYSYRPSWMPDGRSVLFVSDQAGRTAVYRMPADASSEAVVVHDDPRAVDEGQFSADGRWLVYRAGSGGGRDILAIRPGLDSAPIALATTAFEEFSPTLSPDSRWLAYSSDETRRTEVYVRPFPGAGAARFQVSREGGTEPTWSRSGRELFYRNAAGDLVAARIAPGPEFRIESERTLFSTREYLTDTRHRAYTVSPDDQAFYFVRAIDISGGESQLIVVLNWFEELKEKVGR
jgi:serine/threonine-protein kinase